MSSFAAGAMAEAGLEISKTTVELAKRIYIPLTSTSPPGLVEADTVDPWTKSGKYALGWTYFCMVLLLCVTFTRIYHLWNDKIRQAIWKQETEKAMMAYYPEPADYTSMEMQTGRTADQLFPREFPNELRNMDTEKPTLQWQSTVASIGPINDTLALFRWIFYRPIPEFQFKKRRLSFPSLAVVVILVIALAFVTCYCFVPQPLYWQSIQYGSPPLAIRAGMIAIAMTPWIVATSMKANLVTMMTGIGHERLGVFHRWGGYLCLFLSLVHTVPFYVTPVWEDGGWAVFQSMFPPSRGIVYGTGIACLVPLAFLCIHSLPFLRSMAYELFVVLHIPAAVIYTAMLFWHCRNYLASWDYLYATVAIWALSYVVRFFSLNWTNPWRLSWLIGDEAAITLMAENAIKVTVPTQMTWRPGQYVYLRMPGISFFENHPFTISSLCSEDFPSEYGENHRDCTLVFRPFGGFTRKVLNTAIEKGPFKTYRAYLEGPYGGMQRELAAFDTVILIAGGSGITAVVSQLLNLIKRMRDGKAVTKKIELVWTMKRLESMDWFKEELRICREFAPPDTVTCQFFVTAAKRQQRMGMSERAPRPISQVFHDKLDGFVANVAAKRTSAMIRDEAQGDLERERELRAEDEDAITSLPRQKYLQPKILPPAPLSERDLKNPLFARNDSLRQLEGRRVGAYEKDHDDDDGDDDTHIQTTTFLAPPHGGMQGRREFHFPAPSLRHNAPVFHYAPPSPRNNAAAAKRESASMASSSRYSYDVNNLPPPPPGPPPGAASNRNSYQQRYQPSPSPTPDSHQQGSVAAGGAQSVQTVFAPPPRAPSTDPKSSDKAKPSSTAPSPEPPRAGSDAAYPFPAAPVAAHTREPLHLTTSSHDPAAAVAPAPSHFDFGFPSTPTEFQKNLMRFAFLSRPGAAAGGPAGWTTEYGRPDLAYMLRRWSEERGGRGFGRRTCVFVCGPPAMRVGVANAVAKLQETVWGDGERDEVFLHTENYAI